MKKINKITFYCVAEGPGRGSEDVKKECNVKCFDFFFFFCLFDGRHGWKNHSQENRTKIEKEEKHAHGKRVRSALSRDRTLELRQ